MASEGRWRPAPLAVGVAVLVVACGIALPTSAPTPPTAPSLPARTFSAAEIAATEAMLDDALLDAADVPGSVVLAAAPMSPLGHHADFDVAGGIAERFQVWQGQGAGELYEMTESRAAFFNGAGADHYLSEIARTQSVQSPERSIADLPPDTRAFERNSAGPMVEQGRFVDVFSRVDTVVMEIHIFMDPEADWAAFVRNMSTAARARTEDAIAAANR